MAKKNLSRKTIDYFCEKSFESKIVENVKIVMKNGKIKANLFHFVLESKLFREILETNCDTIIIPDHDVEVFKKVKELFSHGNTYLKEEEIEDLEELLFNSLMFDEKKFNLRQEKRKIKRSNGDGTLMSLKNPRVCRYCAQFFIEAHARRKHEEEMHENTQKYSCDKCNASFNTLNGLAAHKKNKHIDSDKTFSCKQCSKQYRSESALKRHCQTEQHSYTKKKA